MKKITVEIRGNGPHNDGILRAIGNHNADISHITLNEIIGYVRIRAAEYPTVYPTSKALMNESPGNVFVAIMENEKTSLIIREEQDK